MRREIMRPYVLRLKIRRTIDTYLDIQSLGIGKPRQTYASADLKIRARKKLSNIELIEEYIRDRGLNPEQTLTRESLTEGATIHTGEEPQAYQLRILRNVQKPRPQGYRRNRTKARREKRLVGVDRLAILWIESRPSISILLSPRHR